MNSPQRQQYWVIWIAFLAAFLLAIFPLPGQLLWLRPEFVAILVIYCSLHLPEQFGLFSAWIAGLGLDILEHSFLGQHALALTVVAYICLMSYQRIRNYAVWHQSIWVFVLVGIHQLFGNWVESLSGRSASVLEFLMPALSSAVIWLPVSTLLFLLRRYYRLV